MIEGMIRDMLRPWGEPPQIGDLVLDCRPGRAIQYDPPTFPGTASIEIRGRDGRTLDLVQLLTEGDTLVIVVDAEGKP